MLVFAKLETPGLQVSAVRNQWVDGLMNLSFAKRLWGLFQALINHGLSGIQAQLGCSVDFVMSAIEEIISTTLCKLETMAILMVAGNVVQYPHSIFDSVRTLTANIALEMAYATGDHRAALFVSGFALMAMALVLSGAAELFNRERHHV